MSGDIDDDDEEYFVYYGRSNEVTPMDVIRVRIHPSVRGIRSWAFKERRRLAFVILHDELEEVGVSAFQHCTSLGGIAITNAVKAIKPWAFSHCTRMVTVTLGDGLEEIGQEAFAWCTWMEEVVIPNAVKAIREGAFRSCSRMTTLTLGTGLEVIEERAFQHCISVQRIVIPNAVRVIENYAFFHCSGITTVTLGDGLEVIGVHAFAWCISIEEIVIPNSVKKIDDGAFYNCAALTNITLGTGLEEISRYAFGKCTLLERIFIPPAVKTIDEHAFKGCSSLTNVEFCAEIEELVTCDAMRDWWNGGVHEKSLSTYCLLVKYDVPARLGLIQVRKWRATIRDMLKSIPSIHPNIMAAYFDCIDFKLSIYEELRDTPALLELAIWKTIINEQFGQNNDLLTTEIKMQCRTNSVSSVSIIVPNVMCFLTDGDDNSGGVERQWKRSRGCAMILGRRQWF